MQVGFRAKQSEVGFDRNTGATEGKRSMTKVRLGALLKLGRSLLLAPSCVALAPTGVAAQGQVTAAQAGRPPKAAIFVPPVPIVHGTWSKGPGEYEFSVCPSGCNINASPGQSVPVTIETWGGGGGGASGKPAFATPGDGGGGGGGGGYGKAVTTLVVPASGTAIYSVTVGRGGAAVFPIMLGSGAGAAANGENGYATMVTGPNGAVLAQATGGKGGASDMGPGCSRCGGASGNGAPNGWGGTAGSPGGVSGSCMGGGGGAGGAGGGPGRSGPGYVNDGGDGGAGGNLQNIPKCMGKTNKFLGWGVAGRDGKAVFTW